jgi:tight adherence protein B
MMFDQATLIMAMSGLIALSVVGVIVALFLPIITAGTSEERLKKLKSNEVGNANANLKADQAKKRKAIQDKLKNQHDALQAKAKIGSATKAPLDIRLKRAGLNWSKQTYILICIGVGVITTIALIGSGLVPAISLVIGGVSAVLLPNLFVSYKIKARVKSFLVEFPNALDVIVRGMKAGLPVTECMSIIAREAAEPLRSEFKILVESQKVGLTMTEAVTKLFERNPMPETNFFALMIGIQAQSGGNLSEALSNLSTVVRDRRKMAAKIQALSMEAKAGAAIIGSLPVAVLILVYLSTPEYISLLFTTQLGNIMLGFCAMMMIAGTLVMRKMINFDF